MESHACARCRAQLNEKSDQLLQCSGCDASYPVLDGLPWLWPEPEVALRDWRNRFSRLQGELTHEIEQLQKSAVDPAQAAKQKTYTGGLAAYSASLTTILEPLGAAAPVAPEVHMALRTALPDHHAVDSYNQNVFRDWVWGDSENHQVLAHLLATLAPHVNNEEVSTILVLGSGAGRLAFDMHQHFRNATTHALDSNPLLSLLAHQITRGDCIEIPEFPRAPVDELVINQTLKIDHPVRQPGPKFICADAFAPPIQPGSIDLLITPWFIDVVDTPLEVQVETYAELLKTDGHWLNHGSLHFNKKAVLQRFSASDVQAITDNNGFNTLASNETLLPYLQNPHDRQQRSELTYTQLSRRDSTPRKAQGPEIHQPAWLTDPTMAVPLHDEFRTQITTTRIRGFIMSLVNGERSINEIGKVLEEQQLMPAEDGAAATAQLLRVMHNERLAQQRKD